MHLHMHTHTHTTSVTPGGRFSTEVKRSSLHKACRYTGLKTKSVGSDGEVGRKEGPSGKPGNRPICSHRGRESNVTKRKNGRVSQEETKFLTATW